MKERESLQSRLGFILLSAGCAIGLGNVWRFPFITGENGGAAFVLLYLLFLVLIGLPVMSMEFAIGRGGRNNIVGSYSNLSNGNKKWTNVGVVSYIGNYLLLMFYTTITGWLIYYTLSAARGVFQMNIDIPSYFSSLMANPLLQIAYMAVALLITALVVLGGVAKSVERITKVMMVILFILMISLAIYSCTLEGGEKGLSFYLKPDFSRMMERGLFSVIYDAMGQAFFTLSLGIGAMTIFGSYIDKKRTLPGESVRIIVLDTAIALLSGLIIFPACFAYNTAPTAGPALLFLSLPEVFSKMNGGRFWGTIFFLAMFFAALSTLIAVFENIVSFWIDRKGMERKKAVALNFCLLFVLSLPCILGYNVLSFVTPLGSGSTILDGEDFLVSNLILPLGSLMMVIFCTSKRGWGWENFLKEADEGEGLKFPKWLRIYSSYILPIIILLVFFIGLIQKFL